MRLKDQIYIMYNKVLQTLAFRSQSGYIPQKPRESGMQSSKYNPREKSGQNGKAVTRRPKAYQKVKRYQKCIFIKIYRYSVSQCCGAEADILDGRSREPEPPLIGGSGWIFQESKKIKA